ncbi:MAG: beta-Ala-His dipeptidase, partial [Bacteroidales bacterium]
MSIRDLKPKSLWNHFYSLTQIPRPSKHEEEAVAFLEKLGKEYGLETIIEECGNIIIRKPATKGMENRKGVILQAHIDMVPQKNSDKVHDFEKDPIETRIVEGWVWANGTTLGADNGLGVAAAMAVLTSNDIAHGPVEALITIDEEAGMTGARLLQPNILKGDILLNLDSEDEGELFIGCAGGLDVNAKIPYTTNTTPKDHLGYSLTVKGLKGGHSGMDIILGRGNANKAITRILLPIMEQYGVELASIQGGSLRNAIPREAFAQITIPSQHLKEVELFVAQQLKEMQAELAAHEPDLEICLDSIDLPTQVIEQEVAIKAIRAIYSAPNGVERMSDALPGVVESSNNLAIVSSKEGVIKINS